MDRNKLLMALECKTTTPIDRRNCNGCPYLHEEGCSTSHMLRDAYIRLKELDDMISIKTVAEWLAGYAAPPNIGRLLAIKADIHADMTAAWIETLNILREGGNDD